MKEVWKTNFEGMTDNTTCPVHFMEGHKKEETVN